MAELAAEPPAVALRLPSLIAGVLDGSPDAVLIRTDSGRENILPAGRLLYTLEARSTSSLRLAQPPAALQAGEILEIQKEDYARAAQAYRALTRSSDPAVRPWALQRLARTEAKAGRRNEALRLYEALERETGAMIGDLPADLVGSARRCELVAGSGTTEDLVRGFSAPLRAPSCLTWRLAPQLTRTCVQAAGRVCSPGRKV